ncbi:MAG: aconitase family protein, partial [Candidatus Velthaea sp.]
AYSDTVQLDLSSVVPSIAGPRRPQDRVALSDARGAFQVALGDYLPELQDDGHQGSGDTIEFDALSFPASDPPTGERTSSARDRDAEQVAVWVAEHPDSRVPITLGDGAQTDLDHGRVVIAAITSCTNTSNPSVMIAAGLLARNAVARGLERKPWVKTSLAPGSKVVT